MRDMLDDQHDLHAGHMTAGGHEQRAGERQALRVEVLPM